MCVSHSATRLWPHWVVSSITPPTFSFYSSEFSVFLDEFSSFLSPPCRQPIWSLLNLLSSVNLFQHTTFWLSSGTHYSSSTFSTSLLSPKLYHSVLSIIDHWPNIADMEIEPWISSHSFRRIRSIDPRASCKKSSIPNWFLSPPSSSDDLLSCYNSTLSSPLDTYSPLITSTVQTSITLGSLHIFRHSNPFADSSNAPKSALSIHSHQGKDHWYTLKSVTSKYHPLIAITKKWCYSSLVTTHYCSSDLSCFK